MRSPPEFYCQLAAALPISENNLRSEFQGLISGSSPKDVFLWLQRKFESGALPKEVEPLITDFFFSVH